MSLRGKRYTFLTSAVGGDCQLHAYTALSPEVGERSTQWMGGWVGPRTGLGVTRRKSVYFPGIEPRQCDSYSHFTD
jgi:hypothetical protein